VDQCLLGGLDPAGDIDPEQKFRKATVSPRNSGRITRSGAVAGGGMRIANRVLQQTAAAVVVTVAFSVAPPTSGADEAVPWSAYAGPQKLVRLPDGRRMNLICMGEGSPVVVLENGLGASAWAFVQYKIARMTRACSYDRAGMGFSDAGPAPRDAAAVVADLHAMLSAADMHGPYVLVGHSMASYFVRLFADLHPKQVAGIVLIDPSLDYDEKRWIAAAPDFKLGSARHPEFMDKCAAAAQAGELKPQSQSYKQCGSNPPKELPPDLASAMIAPYEAPAMYRTEASEFDNIDRDMQETATHRRSYGDIPIIVLTAGEQPNSPTLPLAENEALHLLWKQMRDEMAALSSRGQNRVVPGVGHYIQAERPQVVIDAVDEVIAEARERHAKVGR
jgi:pimeloyl-ACP methyl ester carboxylesterase